MPAVVHCPRCRAEIVLPDRAVGKTCCPRCKALFRVPRTSPPALPQQPPPGPSGTLAAMDFRWVLGAAGACLLALLLLTAVLLWRKQPTQDARPAPNPLPAPVAELAPERAERPAALAAAPAKVAVPPAREKPAAGLPAAPAKPVIPAPPEKPGEAPRNPPPADPIQPPKPAPKPVEAARDDANDPFLSVRDGDTEVKVMDRYREVISVYDQDNRCYILQGNDEPLVVELAIINHSQTRKLDYKRWQVALGGTTAIRDELGNRYKLLRFGRGDDLFFRQQTQLTLRLDESVHPRTILRDLLVCERPVPGAKMLYLALPGATVGGRGTLKLQVPTPEGILQLLSDQPVAVGLRAWVEIDGVQKANWVVGSSGLELPLPDGTYRVTVYSTFLSRKSKVFEKQMTIRRCATSTEIVGR